MVFIDITLGTLCLANNIKNIFKIIQVEKNMKRGGKT